MPWVYCNLMIPLGKVNFAEPLCILQPVKDVVNAGQWVLVKYCICIQCTIINAHSHAAIFFTHKQYGVVVLRRACAYTALCKECIELCAYFIKLLLAHAILPVMFDWLLRVKQLDFVFDWSFGRCSLRLRKYIGIFVT